MPEKPELRLAVDNTPERAAESERLRDIFLRLRDAAPDPDGRHLWLLLEPAPGDHRPAPGSAA